MKKNVATVLYVFVWDTTTGLGKTGDAANLTVYYKLDSGSVTALTDTSATEVDSTHMKGWYAFDAAQAETNGDLDLYHCQSSTGSTQCMVAQPVRDTIPTTGLLAPATAGRTLVIDSAGLADANAVKVGPSGSGTAQTARDLGLALPAAAPNANGGLPILSGTTLAYTVTTVTTAANVTTVNGLAANAITAASIAADAITAAKIADGAIDAATFAAGAIDSSAIATDAITATKIAADAIGASELATTAVAEIAAAILATPANLLATDSSGRVTVGSLAANSITSTAIATDAIGAAELAADAVAEIAAAILSTPANLLATDASGRVTVGSLAAGSITSAVVATDAIDADALASDAVTEIQAGLATSANQTTILNRLGAFTGSGVNTVLGFFKALLKSDALTPSDVGGTFDPATDSTQAIRDRGDAAWVTATGFSTHSAADVWAVTTRVLTAGTNIQLPANGLANVTTWTVAITGNITGNLSGSVGSATVVNGLANNVITTASINDGALTDAKITVPAEASGRPTGILGMVRRVFEWMANKRTRDRADGTVLLRNAADSATLETQTQSSLSTVDTISKGA